MLKLALRMFCQDCLELEDAIPSGHVVTDDAMLLCQQTALMH